MNVFLYRYTEVFFCLKEDLYSLKMTMTTEPIFKSGEIPSLSKNQLNTKILFTTF